MKELECRDYQVRAIAEIRRCFHEGCRRVILCSPTGSGKTVMFCLCIDTALRKKPDARVLLIAHREELIEQISAQLEDLGRVHSVLVQNDPRFIPGHQLQVASIATLVRREEELKRSYDLIVIDEAHHTPAAMYRKVLKLSPFVIGATATPYRLDGRPLGDYYDGLVIAAQVKELIGLGYLAKPAQHTRAAPDLTGVEEKDGDYVPSSLAERMAKPELVAQVIQEWNEKARGKRTIVYSVVIDHGAMLLEAFRSAGANAEMITGETAKGERKRIVADFREGRLDVLVNCMVFVEGFDVPECEAIVLARPTKSRGLWKQMCGRGLRPAPGKSECLLLDHAGLYSVHGSIVADEHPTLVRRVEPKERIAKCPACKKEVDPEDEKCPWCGAELAAKEELADEADAPEREYALATGAMVCIEDPKLLYLSLAERARARARALRNRSRNWAARLRSEFRRLFGRWPETEDQGPDPALHTTVKRGHVIWVTPLPGEESPP